MFTRIVELTAAPGKAKELSDRLLEKGLPIMRQQPGFIDAGLLVSDSEPDHLLALSNWKTKADAERYHREQYPTIHGIFEKLIGAEPCVRNFDVYLSTSHRIAAGKTY